MYRTIIDLGALTLVKVLVVILLALLGPGEVAAEACYTVANAVNVATEVCEPLQP